MFFALLNEYCCFWVVLVTEFHFCTALLNLLIHYWWYFWKLAIMILLWAMVIFSHLVCTCLMLLPSFLDLKILVIFHSRTSWTSAWPKRRRMYFFCILLNNSLFFSNFQCLCCNLLMHICSLKLSSVYQCGCHHQLFVCLFLFM